MWVTKDYDGKINAGDEDIVNDSMLPQILFTDEQKLLAHKAFYRAISQGLIIRPDYCARCGTKSTKTIHGHHHMGYAEENWLNVQFLCHSCHTKAHRAVDPWERFLFNCKLVENCWIWNRKGRFMKFSPRYRSGETIYAREFSYCRTDLGKYFNRPIPVDAELVAGENCFGKCVRPSHVRLPKGQW